jgi:hypothetical protein
MVPSAFLDMTGFRIPGRISAVTVYNADAGQWVSPLTQDMSLLMRFDAPRQLGRLAIDTAALTVDVKAPGWLYDVIVFRDEQIKTVRSGQNLLGKTTFTLTGDNVPHMLDDGGIGIGISIRAVPDQAAESTWSIKSMELTITATVEGAVDE